MPGERFVALTRPQNPLTALIPSLRPPFLFGMPGLRERMFKPAKELREREHREAARETMPPWVQEMVRAAPENSGAPRVEEAQFYSPSSSRRKELDMQVSYSVFAATTAEEAVQLAARLHLLPIVPGRRQGRTLCSQHAARAACNCMPDAGSATVESGGARVLAAPEK